MLKNTTKTSQDEETYTVSYLGYVGKIPIRYIFKVPYMLPDGDGLRKSKKHKGEFILQLHNFAIAGKVQVTDRSQLKPLMTEVRIVEILEPPKKAKRYMDEKPEKRLVLCLPYGHGGVRGYVLIGYRNYVLAQKETYILKGGSHDFNHLFE